MNEEILIGHLLKIFELPVDQLHKYFKSFGYTPNEIEGGSMIYSHPTLDNAGVFCLTMIDAKINFCTFHNNQILDIELLASKAIEKHNFEHIQTKDANVILDNENLRLMFTSTFITLAKRNLPFGYIPNITVEMSPPPAL